MDATADQGEPMIRLDGVSKTYGDGTVAVRELDLDVGRGELVCLVGPSGCGKSTTLKMINRLVEPSTGVIEIDGRDVTHGDPVKLRRGIGYVIQQDGLFPHQRIITNVMTVPLLYGESKATARERARELLSLVGLDPGQYGERYPHQLSGGQRQRVGVARALAADPPVLLMDEPFGAVDPVVRARLQEEFRRLQQELEKTVVFVTHDIDEAATFVGAERGLRRLSVTRIDPEDLEPVDGVKAAELASTVALGATLEEALAKMLHDDRAMVGVTDGPRFVGVLTPAGVHRALRNSLRD